jgi:cytoplasmic tRNA 2-thiolation protein 1
MTDSSGDGKTAKVPRKQRTCHACRDARAVLRRPKTMDSLCRECFYRAFEEEVHQTIMKYQLFKPGERVALAASGGKDSTVLAHVVTTLNARYKYGLDLLLLSIDEGISGYRDDSLDTVKRNEETYGIPLHVFSYKDLYGWTMDEIVQAVGTKNNCTFCGVFRRQALDRGAHLVGATKMATGHNADDIAETVLLNMLRSDVPRLGRCASAITGDDCTLPRVKPFKYTYEKEIVMYAYFKRLDYFSTECKYSPFAARGLAREFVKDLEAARPRAIVDLVKSAERLEIKEASKLVMSKPGTCKNCGYLSSQDVCKACLLLEGLNKGLPQLGIGNSRAAGKIRVKDSVNKECGGYCDCQVAEKGVEPLNTDHKYLKSVKAIDAHPAARHLAS